MPRPTLKPSFLPAVILSLSFAAAACADIGGVGSPNTPAPSTAPEAAAPNPDSNAIDVTAPAIAPQPSEKPLLLIRFNQKNVYFQEPLKKIVGAVNKTKPTATYEIRSVLPAPANSLDVERVTKAGDANLRAVVAEFGRLGVPFSKLSIVPATTAAVQSQEIRIYVK